MIEWSETRRPNKECSYTHVVAMTLLGEIRIEWKGWKERPSFDANMPWDRQVFGDSLDEMKEEIQTIWNDMVQRLFDDLLQEWSKA